MKKYGIMGGTFDPIHYGHLMISEYIRDEMNLDEIIFVPTGSPPHKKDILDASIRYEMTKIGILENKYFTVSDIETKKEDTSYSVDTIKEFESILDGDLYFIVGSDTLFQLKTWKRFDELAKRVEFIVAVRPEYMSTKILDLELSYLREKYESKIHLIETPLYEISSTDLRERLSSGKSVKYLIPDKLIKYIEEKGLYKETYGRK
ncbi:nicotinate-nucleotide adenylyltransferase [Peptoniphilus catoniae]|uniref:nicotinate-nucleotide adenylyltransferase n=1 Tax=Peptoniphilus catoniae TaxID=1660341 RepID=UPI0010FE652C|nr:nicotinate-nucleotide adenylyltransferase [Peptoniphilus catoniae]